MRECLGVVCAWAETHSHAYVFLSGGVLEGGGREELCDIVRKILFRSSPCHILFLEQSSGGKAEGTLRYV